MEEINNKINGTLRAKPQPVCHKYGATFKDIKGLNGHMAVKHGSNPTEPTSV